MIYLVQYIFSLWEGKYTMKWIRKSLGKWIIGKIEEWALEPHKTGEILNTTVISVVVLFISATASLDILAGLLIVNILLGYMVLSIAGYLLALLFGSMLPRRYSKIVVRSTKNVAQFMVFLNITAMLVWSILGIPNTLKPFLEIYKNVSLESKNVSIVMGGSNLSLEIFNVSASTFALTANNSLEIIKPILFKFAIMVIPSLFILWVLIKRISSDSPLPIQELRKNLRKWGLVIIVIGIDIFWAMYQIFSGILNISSSLVGDKTGWIRFVHFLLILALFGLIYMSLLGHYIYPSSHQVVRIIKYLNFLIGWWLL